MLPVSWTEINLNWDMQKYTELSYSSVLKISKIERNLLDLNTF